jgi:uncharacterized protein (DUF58 family)
VNDLRAAILRGARALRRSGSAVRGTRPGDGFAFSQLRGYVEGDDPRRIDHAATARAGALQTRVYHEETQLVLVAILDESPSMNVGRKRTLAAAGKDALHTWFGAAEGDDQTVRIVDGGLVRDRRAARLAVAAQPESLASSIGIALRVLTRGASLLVITDGFDEVAIDVLRRAGRRFDATVLLARDPWSDGLPLRGIVRVRDAETGIVRGLFAGEGARRRYAAATRQRATLLHERYVTAGWRVGVLTEEDGRTSLLRAFGLRA